MEWTGHRLLLVDTGGYDTTEDAPFAGHIREQVEHAIAAADVVLFVLDGRAGPLTDDYAIADVLRRAKAPVIVVANKMDDPASTATAPEIYALGLGEPAAGIGGPRHRERRTARPSRRGHRRRTGRRRGGSSAGRDARRHRRPPQRRQVVAVQRHRRRDAHDRERARRDDARRHRQRDRHRVGRFRFIDTAGMRKAAKVSGVEYYSYLRSVQSLDRAHVAIIVVDATMRFGELDLSICTEATRRNCATVLAVNKCDIAEPDLEEIAGIAKRKLRQRPPVIAVSAESRRGVKELLRKVAELDALLHGAHLDPRPQSGAGGARRRPADAAEARQAPQDVLHRPVRHLTAAHGHRDQRPHAGHA